MMDGSRTQLFRSLRFSLRKTKPNQTKQGFIQKRGIKEQSPSLGMVWVPAMSCASFWAVLRAVYKRSDIAWFHFCHHSIILTIYYTKNEWYKRRYREENRSSLDEGNVRLSFRGCSEFSSLTRIFERSRAEDRVECEAMDGVQSAKVSIVTAV